MSAGICILNRNAIAMAADSAVTIGNHAAIHNSANKLFSLSKVAPVGAIIYSNSMLMEVPVEIIVKEYKKQLKRKTFQTLQEYVDDFIDYLENYWQLLRFDQNEEKYVMDVFFSLISGLEFDYNQMLKEKESQVSGRSLTDEELSHVAQNAYEQTMGFLDGQERVPESHFKDYIEEKYRDAFYAFITNRQEFSWMTDNQINLLLDKIVILYDTKFERNGYVGIAIAGFGDAEIFPHISHIHISGLINGKARYYYIETIEINEQNTASIVPLAQTDVMQTFLFGINDQFIADLANVIPNIIHESIDKIDDSLFVLGEKDRMHVQLGGLTDLILQHMTNIARDKYMIPIIQSVASLPIEELALLAESMINITSVRRKVAIDRNIGTVGGPIDVSIISKGDGFIWLKRKHYFEQKYNPQFLYSHYGVVSKGEEDDG